MTHWPLIMRCIMAWSRHPDACASWQKGRRPVSIWNSTTPAAQTSTPAASYVPLDNRTCTAADWHQIHHPALGYSMTPCCVPSA